jgi:endonuclease YncB( thermonuclease family)
MKDRDMRIMLVLTGLMLCAAAPVLAQAPQPAMSGMKTERKDLGDVFSKWMSGDEKPSVATSTPSTSSTPSQSGGGFGSSVSGFFSNLLPSGKSEAPVGSGPVRLAIEGSASAGDANVLEVRKSDGSVVKVRQWGLEAPETSQWPWGPRARAELDRLLTASGGKVKCTSDGSTTRSGNVVARCFAGETDISATLIEGGYGVEWREVSGGAYTQLEKAAQAAQRGVWEKR